MIYKKNREKIPVLGKKSVKVALLIKLNNATAGGTVNLHVS
jgi:hypothetical protein